MIPSIPHSYPPSYPVHTDINYLRQKGFFGFQVPVWDLAGGAKPSLLETVSGAISPFFYPLSLPAGAVPSASYRVISNRKSYLAVDLSSSTNSSQLLPSRPCLRPFIENLTRLSANINPRQLLSITSPLLHVTQARAAVLPRFILRSAHLEPCPALSSSSPPHFRPTLARDPQHYAPVRCHSQKGRLFEQPHSRRTIQASRFADTVNPAVLRVFHTRPAEPLIFHSCSLHFHCARPPFDLTSLVFSDISFEVSRSLQEPTKSAHLFVLSFVRSPSSATTFNPANDRAEPKPKPKQPHPS